MAIIKCPECGKEISNMAKNCPNCGCPIKMEEIKNLNLPGIDFIASTKRYYPNGDFASYIVGYAKQYTRINIKEV